MSPEQARGKALDHRADVWALAVITYHLLTTQFPFDGATPKELFKRLIRVEPFPITDHRQDLPPAVGDLFARAFGKRIEDRFQSAEAFAHALTEACREKEVLRPIITPMPELVRTLFAANVDSDIVAAGVPRSGGMRRALAVAAVALLALGGGFAISQRRAAHADSKTVASGLAAGASTEPDTMTDGHAPLQKRRPHPAAPTRGNKPRHSRARRSKQTRRPSRPPPAPTAVEPQPTATPAAAPPPQKPADKSEVF